MMRLSTTVTLALAAVASASVIEGLTARHGPGGTTTTTTTTTTTISTICACISGSLTVGGINVGNFATELCTCQSVLTTVVSETSTRSPIVQGIRRGGRDRTIRAIHDRLGNCPAKDRRTCTHPANSKPACSRQNLCGYTCLPGFIDCGGTCKTVCPTAGLSNPGGRTKRDVDYWGHRVQKSCATGWTSCGVHGGGPRDWECVDTKNDLESCGGCPTGTVSSLTDPGAEPAGVDCSALSHVADVACVAGRCSVRRCLNGFAPSADGSACVEKAPTSPADLLRNTFQAAAAYGLEHLPFSK